MGLLQQRQKEQVHFIGDDTGLTCALKAGQPGAREALYRRYAAHVRGVLVRVLGTSVDVTDHLHSAFIEIFSSINSIRDGACLKQWVTRVAVYTAIGHIKGMQRRRWLTFVEPESLPEQLYEGASEEHMEAVEQVYHVLSQMSATDRVVFCLRIIDGMPLKDLAQIFEVSLATIKRRVSRAQSRFAFHIKDNPVLAEWISHESAQHVVAREA